jgi:hypothetical protein
MSNTRFPKPTAALAAAWALGLAACGVDLTLPPATRETVEDTVVLYALSGTPVNTPSAYNLLSRRAERTDRTNDFDFAIDFAVSDTDTVLQFLPRGALGFPPDGGLQVTTVGFDSLLLAPEGGYQSEEPVVADSGAVLVAASRRQVCNFGITRPYYAKLSVEAVDRVQRSVTLRLRIDPNCGYRGLGPGIPAS